MNVVAGLVVLMLAPPQADEAPNAARRQDLALFELTMLHFDCVRKELQLKPDQANRLATTYDKFSAEMAELSRKAVQGQLEGDPRETAAKLKAKYKKMLAPRLSDKQLKRLREISIQSAFRNISTIGKNDSLAKALELSKDQRAGLQDLMKKRVRMMQEFLRENKPRPSSPDGFARLAKEERRINDVLRPQAMKILGDRGRRLVALQGKQKFDFGKLDEELRNSLPGR